jgi:hypothetical protein
MEKEDFKSAEKAFPCVKGEIIEEGYITGN